MWAIEKMSIFGIRYNLEGSSLHFLDGKCVGGLVLLLNHLNYNSPKLFGLFIDLYFKV